MAKKLYYKIGEACKMLEIQPYVLRYWETEFPPLSPTKSKSGQRVYSDQDLTVIRRIKELLYDEGYTIAGAKKKLETEGPGGNGTDEAPAKAGKPSKSARKAAAHSPEEFAPEDESQVIEEPEEADLEPDADVDFELAAAEEPAVEEPSAPEPAAAKKRPTRGRANPELEKGLREVLAEARELLSLLDAAP